MTGLLFAGALLLHSASGSATTCGDAYYNHAINWPQTSNLYFSVAGAPPNAYGDLYVSRNGSAYQKTTGWIHTDSAGNATKGPWTYASQTGDETAYTYIDWGTCSSPVVPHVWDVSTPTASISSSAPYSFQGTAHDGSWGAGFDASWAYCYGEYEDLSTSKWWNGSSYSATSPVLVACSLSGMPAWSINWSTTTSQRPSVATHVYGDHYLWTALIWDGGHWATSSTDFWY